MSYNQSAATPLAAGVKGLGMSGVRDRRGARSLLSSINNPSENSNAGDVEDGLKEPLLSRRDVDADKFAADRVVGAGDSALDGDAEEERASTSTAAAAAVDEEKAAATTEPAPFFDLFLFADKVAWPPLIYVFRAQPEPAPTQHSTAQHG